MSNKRLNNLYHNFKQIPCIQKHFQIDGYHFEIERIDNYTFYFISTKKYNLKLEMPDEIIDYIQSYLIEKAVIKINYPNDYPFKYPKFSLVSGIQKYEIGLCGLNFAYYRDWSPAIIFEKDILYLIQYII
jgi:ubiquitin-protein ligase